MHGAKLGALSRKGTFSFSGLSPGTARAAPVPCQERKGRWHSVPGYCCSVCKIQP